MKKYLPIAEAKLSEVLPGNDIERAVVPCRQPGLRAAAKALEAFATKRKADSLVISTHARRGLERMALGSFAETVILSSKIPVLIVNPAQKIPHSVRRILVPTDLSRKSEKFVESLASYAKDLKAEIILYYKQPDPLDPIIQQGVYSLGGGWVSVQNYLDTELEEKNKQIAKIEEKIRKHHVQVSHVFDSTPGALIDSIERAARDKGADMVSVLTQSGEWDAILLGSVARGLVRHSPVPVLVKR
jgi:nucleotide-binding universal stress UspA family protein